VPCGRENQGVLAALKIIEGGAKMAEENEASTKDAIKALVEMLQKDEEFKRSLGQHTVLLILATLAIATVELTVGLPFVTLTTAPFVGAIIVFLIASVKMYLQSGKPEIVFYLCSNDMCPGPRILPIRWSALPKYRKLKACASCGKGLIKSCPSGRHFIVSPNPSKPDALPNLRGFCPFCDERVGSREYLSRSGTAT